LGNFYVAIDLGLATEEKVLCASRTGATITVAGSGRGADGTAAVAHSAAATVHHVGTALDFDEANQTVKATLGAIVAKGDLLSGSASQALTKTTVGSNNLLLVADSAQGGGMKWAALPAGAISSATMFGAGVVDAAAIGPAQVDTSELADLSVTTGKIAALAVTTAKIAALAVTAAEIAANAVTTGKILDANVTTAKILDANVTLAKLAADVTVEHVPVGVLAPFAGAEGALPTGWLLCYGQAVSRSTYSALFTVIATTYGVGDGSTTFNLPDLRGRKPTGLDNIGGSDAGRLAAANTLGGTGGEELHTQTEAELATHDHDLEDPAGEGTATNVISETGGALTVASGSNFRYKTQTATGFTTDSGSSTPFNVMDPYILMNWIIKH
jgi:microcystin-dependent protein